MKTAGNTLAVTDPTSESSAITIDEFHQLETVPEPVRPVEASVASIPFLRPASLRRMVQWGGCETKALAA